MRLSPIFLVLCLFIIVPVSSGVHFLEVYPDTWINGDEDEYITITGEGKPGLYTISDGEGTISFSLPEMGSGTCIIARNGTAFRNVWNRFPDYEILDSSSEVPGVKVSGRFQLSNKKDELVLTEGGITTDSVSWPGTFRPRKGQIHIRSDEGMWDTRVLMAGGSRLVPKTFPNVSGVLFVSPDCSRQVFEDAITSAKESILLNVYEFTDPGFADLVCDAQRRGVRVSVLLEGGPVGGIPAEEFPVIYNLTQAGVLVRVMEGDSEDHAPYRYDHAKYLVIDNRTILLTTENFKEHSFPKAGYSGNRGYGVLLISPDLAGYFSDVFEDDWNGPGIAKAEGRTGVGEEPVVERYTPVFTTGTFSDAAVTPVFSPDTSMLIVDMIQKSNKRVWIEQAYITDYPGNATNPFLESAIDAARRGADVRILLDGYYYNIEGEDDNDEMVTRLMTLAVRENIRLQARVLYPETAGLLKVHTKGVIADDQVLVSSMNWNENSACFNREAGVIIRSNEAASYFASVFLADWDGQKVSDKTRTAPEQDSSGQVKMIALAFVFVILIIMYRRYHR